VPRFEVRKVSITRCFQIIFEGGHQEMVSKTTLLRQIIDYYRYTVKVQLMRRRPSSLRNLSGGDANGAEARIVLMAS